MTDNFRPCGGDFVPRPGDPEVCAFFERINKASPYELPFAANTASEYLAGRRHRPNDVVKAARPEWFGLPAGFEDDDELVARLIWKLYVDADARRQFRQAISDSRLP